MTSSRLKVLTFVGTRPEIIKLSRVIPELDRHTDHVLVHTGQNYDYELNEVFFADLEIRPPDHFLEAAGASAAETIGAVIARSDAILEREKPDAVLLYGDTNSCLAVIAAKRRKVPVFHMEAGNRSFDERVPEEINRRIVDHLSDVNMTNSEHARRYLLREGLRPELVIKTGSPMREVLRAAQPRIEQSAVLDELGLVQDGYFVFSSHREENVDEPRKLRALIKEISRLQSEFGLPVVISTHPRTRKRLEGLGETFEAEGLMWLKPFGFLDYIALQMSARCVISDSGTITEESSILGFPAVMMRDAHERPEGIDVGAVPFVGPTEGRLVDTVRMVIEQNQQPRRRAVADYEVDNVAQSVVRIIMSYTGYVNRVIWRGT